MYQATAQKYVKLVSVLKPKHHKGAAVIRSSEIHTEITLLMLLCTPLVSDKLQLNIKNIKIYILKNPAKFSFHPSMLDIATLMFMIFKWKN